MIGRRSAAIAVVGGIGLVALLGAGAPRPELDAAARQMVLERATDADTALEALAAALRPAVEAGRAGSARVVAGDEAPAPKLLEAADLVLAAADLDLDARRALAALEQARRADDPRVEPLSPPTQAGDLGSIAGQLRASAEAGEQFAAMRQRAANVVQTLDDALAALAAGDLDSARELMAEARADHDAVAGWDVDLVTLPVWIETTGAMIDAVERIVDATDRGDVAAAEEAAADFAALGDDGATADRALRIAIGEGGSAIAATPLERLGVILSSVDELRSQLAGIREAAA